MSLLQAWVHSPAARALAWTLVHSLWEGALVALAVVAVLSISRNSRIRYAAACTGMLSILAVCAATFRITSAPVGGGSTRAFPLDWYALGTPGSGTPGTFSGFSGWLPWLAPVWALGVLLFSLRGIAGWIAAGRLRRTGVCPEHWQARLSELAGRMRVSRPVLLIESALVAAPAVAGWLRPVILTPVGMLAGLPAAQVESILLHELSHIRRLDYLVNLLQSWVEVVLFYHPAVWWISGVIRAERENCCDDLVVAATGDAREYAAALATLEYRRSTAVAATGGSLMKRIQRILRQSDASSAGLAPVWTAGILTIATAAGLAAWQASAPPPDPVSQALQDARRIVAQVRRLANPPQAALPVRTPYEKWLNEDVLYLVDDRERSTFEGLRTDEEHERFIEQFWTRHNRDEHYRRIRYANQRYGENANPGWKTARGRTYIVYGPPDEIYAHPMNANVTIPNRDPSDRSVILRVEEWRYENGVKLAFVTTDTDVYRQVPQVIVK